MSSAAAISIVRLPHDRNYTVIDNEILAGGYLSIEAIGLLAHLLSRPANWGVSITQLAAQMKCGRDKIQRIMNELRDAGHARLRTIQGDKGQFGGKRWEIFEARSASDGSAIAEIRQPENRPVGEPAESLKNRPSENRPVKIQKKDYNKIPPIAPLDDVAPDAGPTFDEFERVYPFGDADPCQAMRQFIKLRAEERQKALAHAPGYVADRKARGLTPAAPQTYLRSRLWEGSSAQRGADDRRMTRMAKAVSSCIIVKGTPEGDAWARYERVNFIWSEKLKQYAVARPTPFPPGYEPASFNRAA